MKESVMKWVFLLAATLSILAVALICVFLFANGVPAIGEIGVFDFLLGQKWKPGNNIFGIFPMIIGSVYVTAGAIIVGVPLGILCAVFLAWFCPKKLYKVIKPAVELLAGIPSIVYGFFGLVVLVPIMQNLFGGSGKG
ncbi:PstC family ABC transporter permease, partial [Anaerotignum sp.]